MHRDIPIFVIVNGQNDNIGDTALRRVFLDCLRPCGRLHVYPGKNNPDYQAGLRLRPEDKTYASLWSWKRALRISALHHRVIYGMNTGEEDILTSFRRYFKIATHMLLLRLQGGGAIHCGHGIRANVPGWNRVHRALLQVALLTTWRDPVSRMWMGGGDVAPDWAFGAGQPDRWLCSAEREAGRGYMTISMRGDRPWPAPHWFAALRCLAGRRGLRLLVVTQVKRDEDRGRCLAEALGADFHPWPSGSHLEHEGKLRDLYRRSAWVVSDRLHVLIFGLTEGAVPVGFTVTSAEKIARTFAAAGIERIAFSQDEVDAAGAVRNLEEIASDASGLFYRLADARRQLEGLAARLRGLTHSGREPAREI